MGATTGLEKSLLARVFGSEAMERTFEVKYWGLGELMERFSKAEKRSQH